MSPFCIAIGGLAAATYALDLLVQRDVGRIAWPFGRRICGAGLDHRRDALTIGEPRALCVRRLGDESESNDDGCNRPQQFLQIFFTVRSTLVFSWSILASVSL